MGTPVIVMYTTNWCPYCERARRMLRSKGAAFEEIDVESAAEKRAEMISRSGRRTVPQIFIGDQHVGGSDDLADLDAAGKLDGLLGR
ncbi:MAG TPA: glutaredoxin 3 [Steroidobacteraceae bacterium]|jgi:glutaredoxin 3|nr:glutaredoxin 3 [Steroidobacteraceae bacterium]